MAQHRALSVVKPRCQPCGDTGVMRLAAHWTGLGIAPATVSCPHCRYPYVAIHTYSKRSAS